MVVIINVMVSVEMSRVGREHVSTFEPLDSRRGSAAAKQTVAAIAGRASRGAVGLHDQWGVSHVGVHAAILTKTDEKRRSAGAIRRIDVRVKQERQFQKVPDGWLGFGGGSGMCRVFDWFRPFVGLAVFAVGICPVFAAEGESLLRDGSFRHWQGDRLQHWVIEIGASRGGTKPVSEVDAVPGPALRLRGDATTLAWRSVGQDVALTAGSAYTLTFQAVAENVRREGSQYDNCYVGVMHFDRSGRKLGLVVEDLSNVTEWTERTIRFSTPAAAAKSRVLVFLSKSGSLTVKGLELKESVPQKPFDELIGQLREHYSFTELKTIRWDQLDRQYGRRAREAESAQAFADAVEPMLLSLEDLHVWMEMPDGSRRATYWSRFDRNDDHRLVRSRLRGLQEFEGIGFTGRVELTGPVGTIGVVVVTSLSSDANEAAFLESVAALSDTDGMIIDLRRNSGGDESRAARIAGLFTKQRVLYARSMRPQSGHMIESAARHLDPVPSKFGSADVICLVGPGCVSSGEGFALMMKAIEGVQLIGQPTRGASGNPSPVTLSNGVRVWFSRWVSLEVDGTAIEGRGVWPDQRVKHVEGSDATFDQAVRMLRGEG